MRPQKRIDRTPRKASAPRGQPEAFHKGRHFVSPEDIDVVVNLDDEVAPLPTAGEAPSKWELRTGLPAREDDPEAVVDLREDGPTLDLRTTVRIVDGSHYERRTSGFRMRVAGSDTDN